MKKIFTVMAVALMMMALPAKAQVGFGLRGGLNLTSVTFSESDLSSSNRAGFFVGPTLKFTVPIVGLGFDVSALYDQRNSGVEGETIIEKNIFVPINLRYQFGLGDMASIFLKAGPQFGWNIGGKTYSLKDISTTAGNIKSDFQLKKSNMSINVGVGAMLLSHLELGITYNIALGKTGEVSYTSVAGDVAKEALDAAGAVVGLKDWNTRTNAWQLNLAYYF